MENPDKKELIEELISIIENQLKGLQETERAKLESVEAGNLDEEGLYEDTREQLVEETAFDKKAIAHEENILEQVKKINLDIEHDQVEKGALVHTNNGCFLISTSFAPVKMTTTTLTGVSAEAPIYQKMASLKKGDVFSLNEKAHQFEILSIH